VLGSSMCSTTQPRKRHDLTVTFDDEVVEIPILPLSAMLQGDLFPRRTSEDAARKNLLRLVANHQKMTKRWSFLEEVRATFGNAFSQHAVVSGDMLLMGRRPGKVDRALLLRGAQVSVLGSTVMIALNDAPSLALQVETVVQAEKWASDVQVAAELWENVHSAADMALLRHSLAMSKREQIEATRPGLLAAAACLQVQPPSDLNWTKLTAWEEGDVVGQVIVDPLQRCFGWLASTNALF